MVREFTTRPSPSGPLPSSPALNTMPTPTFRSFPSAAAASVERVAFFTDGLSWGLAASIHGCLNPLRSADDIFSRMVGGSRLLQHPKKAILLTRVASRRAPNPPGTSLQGTTPN